MTDLVVGSGAVGTFLAWALRTGGRHVTIVRRRHEGPSATASLRVLDRAGQVREAEVTIVSAPSQLASPPDLIVFAVKMYDLEAAVESCAMWPGSVCLTVQNGVGAEEMVVRARPSAPLIAGSFTASVERHGEVIESLTRGGLALAPFAGSSVLLVEAIVGAVRGAGLRARRLDDPRAMKWSKLLANLVANATGAILDLPVDRIYGDARLFDVERRQLTEALAVMRHLGLRPVALPGADMRFLALGMRLPPILAQPVMRQIVGGARGGKDPSLRIQARTGNGPSEVEWLNGAVARAGDTVGVDAPVNRRLTELVLEVLADPTRHAWFRGRPDRLLEALVR